MPRAYFVRHGQSLANAKRVIAGQQDSPLTDLGRSQAAHAALGIKQKNISIDLIVSSPLSRARDTAKIIADDIEYENEIIIIDELKEKFAGDFEGGEISALYAASDEELSRAHAESFEAFADRVKAANKKIQELQYTTLLIVGHSGFYRMSRCLAALRPPAKMIDFESPKNSVVKEYIVM